MQLNEETKHVRGPSMNFGTVEYTDCISAEGQDSPNECPAFDTKQFDDEVSVMLELCGMRSTPPLPSIPGPLWPRVVAPDRPLSMEQTELNCVLMLNWIARNKTLFDIKTVLR